MVGKWAAFVAAVAIAATVPGAEAVRGAVSLDSLTFDKIVDGSKQIVVKFDKQYAYGEKEDAYKAFVKDVANSNLLVGEVGVQDYGDKENDDLRERFDVKTDDFPVFKLFRKGGGNPITYTGAVTADGLRNWVTRDAGVWIGAEGRLEAFDKLAEEVTAETKTVDEALARAADLSTALDNEADQKSARIYTTILKKMKDKGITFAAAEIKRVEGLAKGKISDAKKAQMKIRLNILQAFLSKESPGQSATKEDL